MAREAVRQVSAADAAEAARSLSDQLIQLIEMHTLEARRVGGQSSANLDYISRFLKAALADEILLSDDWAGREHWRHVLLETQLFRTSQAGDKVFADIEQILSQREPSQRNTARLYLNVLSLGFQGRFRGGQKLDKISEYRHELYQFIYQRAADLQGRDRVLSRSAYASTLSHLTPQRLPRVSRWWLIVLLTFLGLLALSELEWLWQSWPVRRELQSTTALLYFNRSLGLNVRTA